MSSPCHFLIENARTCHLGVDLANTWQFKDALPDFPTLRERMKNKWWFQTECPFCTFILSCLIVMIQTGHFTERNFSDSSQTLSNSTGTCHINLVGPSTFGRSRLHEFSSGKLSQWNYDHCREIATIYLNLDFLPRYGKRLSRECPIILLPEVVPIPDTYLQLPDNTFARKNIDFISQHLTSCRLRHIRCNISAVRGDGSLIRLIDVTKVPEGMIEIADNKETRTTKYLTLSYVWGNPPNPAEFGRKHSIKELAPLIKDAIVLTHALGFRYLWIDELCINQQDDDDKAREISKMNQIYSCATATIIVTCCKSKHEPFQGSLWTSKEGLSYQVGRRKKAGKMSAICLREPRDLLMIDGTPWSTRGWTLQEDLLSRRRIFFTAAGIYYECLEVQDLQSFWIHKPETPPRPIPDEFPKDASSSTMNSAAVYNQYYECVSKITKRKFTNELDRLPAAAGLAQRIELVKNDEFSQGIPLSDAVRGLLWTPAESPPSKLHWEPKDRHWPEDGIRRNVFWWSVGKVIKDPTLTNMNPYKDRCTWSWASCNNPIQFPTSTEFTLLVDVQAFEKRNIIASSGYASGQAPVVKIVGRPIPVGFAEEHRRSPTFFLPMMKTGYQIEGLILKQEGVATEWRDGRDQDIRVFSRHKRVHDDDESKLWARYRKTKPVSLLLA